MLAPVESCYGGGLAIASSPPFFAPDSRNATASRPHAAQSSIARKKWRESAAWRSPPVN
jgi:hypothetical protein